MTEAPRRLRILGVELAPKDETRLREIHAATVTAARGIDAGDLSGVIGLVETLGRRTPAALEPGAVPRETWAQRRQRRQRGKAAP